MAFAMLRATPAPKIISNLGTQYVDAGRPATPPGIYPFSYTEKFAKLGRAIDTYEKTRR